MNVLHVSDAIDPSRGGGTAERTFQLAMALRRAGVFCSILCTDLGLGDKRRAELEGVDLIAVPTLLKRFLVPSISRKRIDQLVGQADVIHVTGHWSILGARVCLAALGQALRLLPSRFAANIWPFGLAQASLQPTDRPSNRVRCRALSVGYRA